MQYWWIGGLVAFGLVVMVVGALASRFAERSLVDKRLGLDHSEEDLGKPEQRKAPVGDAFDEALASRGLGTDLATQLARADMKITVGEFLAVTVMLMILSGGVAYLLKKDLVVMVGAIVLGFFAPRFYVTIQRKKRLRAFNEHLGDSITLMVNALRAGYSVLQAMEARSVATLRRFLIPSAIRFGNVSG